MSYRDSEYQRMKKKRLLCEEESMLKFYEPINRKEKILNKYLKPPEK